MAEVKQEDQASSIDLKKHTDSKLTLKEEFPLRWLNFRLFLCILSSVDIIEIVRAMAINNLGLDFSMTHDDITAFEFIAKDSLRNLKHACYTEKIRDFLHCVFVESGAANVLGRGDFRWKLFIYKMSPEEYHNYTQITVSGKFIQATMVEKKKILALYVEELDPAQLFGDLMIMGLVDETDKDKVMDCIPRKQRIEFLIGRLAAKKRTDEMYDSLKGEMEGSGHKILMVHCMKHDYQYLWKKINDIFRGDTGNLNLTGKRVEDESFPGQRIFNAHFTTSVKGAKKVDIDIQDRNWHDDTVEAVEKEIVIMGFKPDWEPTEEKVITTEEPHQKRQRMHDEGHLLSDQGLYQVARRLGKEWSLVAVNLDLTQAEIDRIQMDKPGQTLNQIIIALTMWHNRSNKNDNENVQDLLNAIEEANRNDLVLELKDEYHL